MKASVIAVVRVADTGATLLLRNRGSVTWVQPTVGCCRHKLSRDRYDPLVKAFSDLSRPSEGQYQLKAGAVPTLCIIYMGGVV